LRTTFLGGAQGGKAEEPPLVDPALFEPAPAEFVESAGLPAAGFGAVGGSEQLGEIVFL
jgi:hypothetical protein